MEGSKISIVKLNNSNFSVWKFKAEMILTREDMWKYIEDEAPEPVTDVWKAGDRKARATIALLVEDQQHALIRETKTAKEAWSNLKKHHEKTSLCSKVAVLKRICNKTFKDGDDMQSHLFELDELFAKLLCAGLNLGEPLMVALVLRSLPDSFDTLTTALESRSDDDLKLELVKGKLLDEVAKRERGPSDSAMKASFLKKKKPLVCHFCQKIGHKQKECKMYAKETGGEKGRSPKAKAARSEETSLSFALMAGAQADSGEWIVDSGATRHMCAKREFLSDVVESSVKTVSLADGKIAKVEGVGSGRLLCYHDNGKTATITLSNVLFVPSLEMNLLSVPKLVEKGAEVNFNDGGCRILVGGQLAATAVKTGGLYKVRTPKEVLMAAKDHHNVDCQHVWHRRFGHRDVNCLGEMLQKNLVDGLKVYDCGVREGCDCCQKAKMSRKPFPKEVERKSSAILDLVHTDVCGPVENVSVSGYRYFMTVIDDYSRFCVLFLLRKKEEVPEKLMEYVSAMKTQFGRPPKIVRSDQGGEYTGNELKKFYKQEGIRAQFTASYSPQQNGVAERKNRYLIEMTRCMLFDAKLPECYWAEAVSTAVYLQNVLPSKSVPATSFELWHGRKPDVTHLKTFGSAAHVHIVKQKRKKLSPTSQKLTFVGYSLDHKAYRFLDRSTRKVIISRDVNFVEEERLGEEISAPQMDICAPNPRRQGVGVDDVVEFEYPPTAVEAVPEVDEEESENESEDALEDESEDESDVDDDQPASEPTDSDTLTEADVGEASQADKTNNKKSRRSIRKTKGMPPVRYHETIGMASVVPEPRSYQEAINGPESVFWKTAMDDEFRSLMENDTWEITSLPADRKKVGCKWIFKRKEDETGTVVRYKARLVAQGYSQKYGADYDEVFAPVARQVTFRALLTVAAERNLFIKHVDIKTAYLYGALDEEIFMKQPPGYETGNPAGVCRLKRSLYGLKQAARVWNRTIDDVFKQAGFVQSSADACLYVRTRNGRQSFIIIYVDDILVACPNETEFEEIVAHLQGCFKLTVLGDIKHFVGIKVTKHDNAYLLNQEAYITKLAVRFGQLDAKGSKIPMDPGYQQKEEDSAVLPSSDQYQSLVGGLLYIAVNSRPDVSISASILGRYVSQPRARDWTEAKRVLRYLYHTRSHQLKLGATGTGLEVYCDADWAGDTRDRKSTSGFLIFLGGGVVSWASRKQSCVALSSTESEFIALAEACQEVQWMLKLLKDLQVKVDLPIRIREDNQSCIRQVDNEKVDQRSKHVDTKYCFIKDLRSKNIINLLYCPTNDMLADMMTKPLTSVKLGKLREAAGVVAIDVEEEC